MVESSAVTAQTTNDESGHETDVSIAGTRSKKGAKRKVAAKGKAKKKNIEDIVQSQQKVETDRASLTREDPMDVSAEIAVLNAEIEKEEAAASKPTKLKGKKVKKVADKAPHLSMPGAFSPLEFREESIEPSFLSAVASDTPPMRLNGTQKAQALQTPDEMEEAVPEKTLTPTPTPRAAPPLPPRSSARIATPRSVAQGRAEAAVTKEVEASPTPSKLQQVSPTPSAQSSDAENAPPSSRPASVRPPLGDLSTTTRAQLNPGTPTRVPLSPSKIGGGIKSAIPWSEVDIDMVFQETPGAENVVQAWIEKGGVLDEKEKDMSVQKWIYANAAKAEEELKRESERVVGLFEKEGSRALQVLEGIECV